MILNNQVGINVDWAKFLSSKIFQLYGIAHDCYFLEIIGMCCVACHTGMIALLLHVYIFLRVGQSCIYLEPCAGKFQQGA